MSGSSDEGKSCGDVAELAGCTKSLQMQVLGLVSVARETTAQLNLQEDKLN